MTRSELEAIVKSALSLEEHHVLGLDEEWDSLDHLAIMTSLAQVESVTAKKVDLTESNTLRLLLQILCEDS